MSEKRIEISIAFKDSGIERTFEKVVEIPDETSVAGEDNLRDYLWAEVEKELEWGRYLEGLPDIEDLPQPTRQSFKLDDMVSGAYHDRTNVQWTWFEIKKVLREVRLLLAQSRAYKALEPEHKANLEENNLLYNLHLNKIEKFDLAVFLLTKVEDLVFRLIFEGTGASLISVDMSDPEWERALTWSKINAALKKNSGNSGNAHLNTEEQAALIWIVGAFRQPDYVSRFIAYRNQVTHRIRPSVDYVELYTYLQNRMAKPLFDAEGREKGRSWGIGVRPTKAEYDFDALYELAVRTMEHYVALLRRLSAIHRFNPTIRTDVSTTS